MDGRSHQSGLDEIQNAILDQADRLFIQQVTRPVLAAANGGNYPDAVWQAVDQAGLPSAIVPEALGGSGLDRRTGFLLIRRAAPHLPVSMAEVIVARAVWADIAHEHDEAVMTIAAANGRDDVQLQRAGEG